MFNWRFWRRKKEEPIEDRFTYTRWGVPTKEAIKQRDKYVSL